MTQGQETVGRRRSACNRGLLLALALAGCGPGGPPVTPSDLEGPWAGSFSVLGNRVELTLVFGTEGDDVVTASVYAPERGLVDIRATAVETDGRTVDVDLRSIGASYRARLGADGELNGDWSQAGGRFRLTMTRSEGVPTLSRPQTPKPPFPYRSAEVEIPGSDAGVVLSGTLTLPEGPGPFPAAVLVSGSGPQDRDETILGHKPFLVIADRLSREGMAVLRYDDRGVARSTGNFASATTADFATDAIAAAAYLAQRDDIDPERVGIIGHSEGGWVGPLAAVSSSDVGFLILLAPVGMDGFGLLTLQTDLILEASGVPGPVVHLNRRIQDEVLNALMGTGEGSSGSAALQQRFREAWGGLPFEAAEAVGVASRINEALGAQMEQIASPWLRYFLTFEPSSTFERVSVPVLALWGTNDLQVPPEPNRTLVEEALMRGPSPSVTMVEIQGLNHLFQHSETGLPTEYGILQETMAPEALDAMSHWIRDHVTTTPSTGVEPQ